MKNAIRAVTTLAFVFASSNSIAGMSYECWSYSGGSLGKMVHVVADNRDQAAQLAADKFRGLSVSFDSVNCK